MFAVCPLFVIIPVPYVEIAHTYVPMCRHIMECSFQLFDSTCTLINPTTLQALVASMKTPVFLYSVSRTLKETITHDEFSTRLIQPSLARITWLQHSHAMWGTAPGWLLPCRCFTNEKRGVFSWAYVLACCWTVVHRGRRVADMGGGWESPGRQANLRRTEPVSPRCPQCVHPSARIQPVNLIPPHPPSLYSFHLLISRRAGFHKARRKYLS